MMVFSATILVTLVLSAYCKPIYDTELVSTLNSVALSTSEDDYLVLTIDTTKKENLTDGYLELLLLEKNNRSDVQSLYYNPEDNTDRLETYHQFTGHSRKLWLLESRNYEKLTLVVGPEWVKLIAGCEDLEIFDAVGQECLLSFLRSKDLEITYPEEVKIQIYKDELQAIDTQCLGTIQGLSEDNL